MTEEEIKKKNSNNLIFFNEALEYLEDSDQIEAQKCKILSLKRSNILRDEMLEELNHLKEVIINNPDLKLESLNEQEKAVFFDFIEYYSICPICRKTNHYSNLKRIYFNDTLESIKKILIRIMNFDDSKRSIFNLSFGIPCCKCYKKYFNET
ncbi:MAG: hypothetical protein ACFFBH_01205 [Promethearchaeota archaeon]